MPLKLMPTTEADSRYRQARKSLITTLPEWRELSAKLTDGGLKPQEAAVVELQNDPKNPNLRGTVKRWVKKYMPKMNLPYACRAVKDGGLHVIIVANEATPVLSRKRRLKPWHAQVSRA